MKLNKPTLTIKHIKEPKISVKDEISFPEPKMAWSLLGPNRRKNSETIIKLGVIGDKESIDNVTDLIQGFGIETKGKNDTLLHAFLSRTG